MLTSERIYVTNSPERQRFIREMFELEPAWLRGVEFPIGHHHEPITLEIDSAWEGDLASEMIRVTHMVMQDRATRCGKYPEQEQPV